MEGLISNQVKLMPDTCVSVFSNICKIVGKKPLRIFLFWCYFLLLIVLHFPLLSFYIGIAVFPCTLLFPKMSFISIRSVWTKRACSVAIYFLPRIRVTVVPIILDIAFNRRNHSPNDHNHHRFSAHSFHAAPITVADDHD